MPSIILTAAKVVFIPLLTLPVLAPAHNTHFSKYDDHSIFMRLYQLEKTRRKYCHHPT